MADVFISYSKARRQETVDLAATLAERGFSVWWDSDITPGETFRDAISTELANARAAIVIWTPPSVKSNWVISEATRAQRRGIMIAVHSADLNIDDIPAPFDVLHTEPVENRPAIFAALARMGVTPSGPAKGPGDLPQGGTRHHPAPVELIWSRRGMLFGGGALGVGAVAAAGLYKMRGPSVPSAPPAHDGPLHILSAPDLLYVSSVAFTVDGRSVMSASWDQCLRLWEPARPDPIRRFDQHGGPVWSVAMLPDGKHALSASADRTLKLWDLSRSSPIRDFKGHQDEVWAVAILPDGTRALSGSKDTTLKLWDLASSDAIGTFRTEAPVRSVAIVPGGRVAVSAGKDPLQSWDLTDGNKIRLFDGHDGIVNCVAVTPNGVNVLSGGDDGALIFWELSSGLPLRKLSDHAGKVLAVATSPSGRTALSGGSDRIAKLWDLATGRVLKTFEGHADSVDAVAIAPDGRIGMTGSLDKTIRLWDLTGTGSGV